jgi:hypothetical protein
MLALEDYFIRRKLGDKINEFDADKKDENRARCIQYIDDYFDAYISKDAKSKKTSNVSETDQEVSKVANDLHTSLEDLPDTLTAKMIAKHLQVSQRHAYNLMQLSPAVGGIPSFQIGKSRRVSKENYLRWLSDKEHL